MKDRSAQRRLKVLNRYTGKPDRPDRSDGYVNMLNRFGTMKDSSEHYHYVPEPIVPDEMLTAFYEDNSLFARIINAPAEEALKHGFEIDGLADEKLTDFYKDELDRLNFEQLAVRALKWTRLYGGAIMVLWVDDGGRLEDPLNWDDIRSIDSLSVYDRSQITPDWSSIYSYRSISPDGTRHTPVGEPQYYDISTTTEYFRVHESRCLIFKNGDLPDNTRNSIYRLWGAPEYLRVRKSIETYEVAAQSAVKLLERSVQPVYKMKGLDALLSTEEGENDVLRRMQVIDMARGFINTMILDADGEDYDFKSFTYSGVQEVVNAACNDISSKSQIPQTVLFGRSPAGMNATGEGDLENWYSYVERYQRNVLRPAIRYLLTVMFAGGYNEGTIDEVPRLDVIFNPLWSLSEAEKADLESREAATQKTRAETAQAYIDMQVLDPSEVRKKLAGSTDMDIEEMLDDLTPEELEEGAKAIEKRAKEQAGEEGGGEPPAAGDSAPPELTPVQPASIETGYADPAVTGYTQVPGLDVQTLAEDVPQGDRKPAAKPKTGRKPKAKSKKAKPEGTGWEDPEKTGYTQVKPKEEPAWTDPEQTGYTQVQFSDPKPKSLGSVGVLVIENGKILTGKRKNDNSHGLVCGPGGHIEAGETPEQAAIRETEEEFGIMPLDLMELGNGPAEPDTGLSPVIFLCTEYKCAVGESGPACDDDEMEEPVFRTLSDLDLLRPSLFQPFADSLTVLSNCISQGKEKSEKNFRKPIDRTKNLSIIEGRQESARSEPDNP